MHDLPVDEHGGRRHMTRFDLRQQAVRHTGPASQADLAQAPPLPQPRDPRADPVFTSHAIPDPGFQTLCNLPAPRTTRRAPPWDSRASSRWMTEHRRIEVTEPGWFQALLRQPG